MDNRINYDVIAFDQLEIVIHCVKNTGSSTCVISLDKVRPSPHFRRSIVGEIHLMQYLHGELSCPFSLIVGLRASPTFKK